MLNNVGIGEETGERISGSLDRFNNLTKVCGGLPLQWSEGIPVIPLEIFDWV